MSCYNGKSIEELRNSGSIPVVNLKIFDSISNLKISEYVLGHIDYTNELYNQYLQSLLQLPKEKRLPFINAIKTSEIIDNQVLEKEDSFLISIYMQMDQENTIDYLLKQGNLSLSRDTFIEGHKRLLRGTKSAKFINKDHRTDNEAFVGRRENGEIKIRYFSLPYTDIDEAIDKTLNFYNSDYYNENLFLQPQIIHGLIASLQMFDDGNTRYARILQNIKLHELTNRQYDDSFEGPTLYGTRAYFPFRDKYRELIGNLATNPDNDNWNEWFDFNLNRMEDQVYFLDNKLEQYRKIK